MESSVQQRTIKQRLKTVLALTKPRIFIAIGLTAWMGLFLQKDFFTYSPLTSFYILIATVMASAAGAVLNHYLERETDALMDRTKDRPLVGADQRTLNDALFFGAFLAIAGHGLCWLTLGWISALWLFLGYLSYVVLYTLIFKHNSLWNVTVGSFSSSFAVLAGDTAMTGQITTNGIILSVLLFFWNPAHFWNLTMMYMKDYKAANIPMLSGMIARDNTIVMILIHVVAVILSAFALHRYGELGLIYLIGCILLNLVFFVFNAQILFVLEDRLFRRNFIFSNIYLMLIYLVIVLDKFFPIPL